MKHTWEPEDVIRGRIVLTTLGGYRAIIAKQPGPDSSPVYAIVLIADGAMSELYDRPSMARHLTSIGAVP